MIINGELLVIAGLGRGGHSYFALDITDIDNPNICLRLIMIHH